MTSENNNHDGKTSGVQTFFRLLLGALLLFSGIGHLTVARVEFLAQVPRWVPLNADLVVVLSGIAEMVLGGALIVVRRWRGGVGWATAAFFVLIFPGNISQYINGIDAFGLNSDRARAIRLAGQPLLVIWALWSTGAWHAWRRRHSKPSEMTLS
ncbi:MAG TPA: MauE/DoxX family redox-associated membrane protein [Herpetosiphonaceae bacterium]|nr:MauE/DoxX family redox-associated membrane protein [Herpetosiphonaceae bacterium]